MVIFIDPSRKYMKEGALPSLNLPVKSVPSKEVEPRSTVSIQKRETATVAATSSSQLSQCSSKNQYRCYKGFADLKGRIQLLKLPEWTIDINDSCIEVKFKEKHFVVPRFQVFIDHSLEFYIRVFGWMLPSTHEIYINHQKSLDCITFSNLLKTVTRYDICAGINAADVCHSINIDKHIIPRSFCIEEFKKNPVHVSQLEYLRSKSCLILLSSNTVCKPCNDLQIRTVIEMRRKESNLKLPAKSTAPVKFTSPERLKLAMQQQRKTIQEQQLECAQLSTRIEEMKQELAKSSHGISNELSNDLVDIFKGM